MFQLCFSLACSCNMNGSVRDDCVSIEGKKHSKSVN